MVLLIQEVELVRRGLSDGLSFSSKRLASHLVSRALGGLAISQV